MLHLENRAHGKLTGAVGAGLLAALLVPATWAAQSPRPAADEPAARKKAEKPAAAPDPETSPGRSAPDPVHEEFLRINYLFNRELYDLAIPRYEALIAANPRYEKIEGIHYALALSYYNLGKKPKKEGEPVKPAPGAPTGASPSLPAAAGAPAPGDAHLRKALSHLKEALKRKEFEPRIEATRLLAQTLLLLGEHENAIKTFRWVLERKPERKETVAAALGLAESLYYQGKHAEAAQAYRDGLALGLEGDERDRAEFYLAMALYNTGQAGAAESSETFARIAARASSPYGKDARYMKALASQAKGDDAGAIEGFRELLGETPGEPPGEYEEPARFGLATALLRAGKAKEAAVELQKFLDSFPRSERRDLASVYLARSLLETGKAPAAARMLQDLRTSPTAGDEASLWLARLYLRHGKAKSAAGILSAALKSHPASRQKEALELELASALLADGDFAAATETLSKLEGSASAAPDQLAYLKAYALHRAGKHAESSAACERFRKDHPESRHLKDVEQLVAENLFLSKDYEAARKAYAAYLARFDADLDPVSKLKARFRGAHSLHLSGRFTEALESLESLATRDTARAGDGDEAGRAFREDAFFATHRYLLGDAAYQLKDHRRADEELTRFLEDPRVSGSAAQPRAAGLEEPVSDAHFKLAHSLQLSGEGNRARESYTKALEADPKSPHREQIQFELGQIAYAEKDYARAAGAFEKLLASSPSSRFAPHALRFLGWIAHQGGDPAAAARHYAKLISAFPDHELAPDAEIQLALSLQASGKKDEARAVLRRFQSKRPGDPRAARAVIEEAAGLSKGGKHAEALEVLERLRKDAPPEVLPAILYEIAWCQRGRNDLEAASAVYREIIGLEGAGDLREPARLELGELEFDRKEYSKAMEILEPLAVEDGLHREKALYRLAWTHHMLEDPVKTVADYEILRKEFPSSPLLGEVALLAAKAHLKRSDHARAGEIFRAIQQAKPDGPEAEAALLGLAECLVEERKFEDARKGFRTFLERYPSSTSAVRARFGLGWIDENLGRLDEAITRYREVARETATPVGARAQFQIGQCLVARKSYRDAIAEFLQVPAGFSYPEWTSKALLQTAGCFEALGDGESAGKYYKEVITTHPERDEAKLARERLAKLETS